MNYRNFMCFITLSLFAYAPLYGMDNLSLFGSEIMKKSSKQISQTVSYITNIFSEPTQTSPKNPKNVQEAGQKLELALNRFISAYEELNQTKDKLNTIKKSIQEFPEKSELISEKTTIKKHILQKTNNLTKSKVIVLQTIDKFKNILQKNDPTFNKPNGHRKKALEDITQALIDNNNPLKTLVSLTQNIANFTMKRIENNNGPLEDSVIIFETNKSDSTKPNESIIPQSQWPDNVEEQIKHINSLNIEDKQKVYLFRLLWHNNKLDPVKRNLFEQQITKKGSPLGISYRFQEGSKQLLPIFDKPQLPIENTALIAIIEKMNSDISKIQKEHNELISKAIEAQYPKIQKNIENENKINSQITIQVLNEYKKLLNEYSIMLSKNTITSWENTPRLKEIRQEEISALQQKIDKIIARKNKQKELEAQMKPFSEEIRKKTEDTAKNLEALIQYKSLLDEYINILPEGKIKQKETENQEALTNKIDSLKEQEKQKKEKTELADKERLEQEQIKQTKLQEEKLIKEKAERETAEKAELEKLEKEKLAKEAQEKLEKQKIENEKLAKEAKEKTAKLLENIEYERNNMNNNMDSTLRFYSLCNYHRYLEQYIEILQDGEEKEKQTKLLNELAEKIETISDQRHHQRKDEMRKAEQRDFQNFLTAEDTKKLANPGNIQHIAQNNIEVITKKEDEKLKTLNQDLKKPTNLEILEKDIQDAQKIKKQMEEQEKQKTEKADKKTINRTPQERMQDVEAHLTALEADQNIPNPQKEEKQITNMGNEQATKEIVETADQETTEKVEQLKEELKNAINTEKQKNELLKNQLDKLTQDLNTKIKEKKIILNNIDPFKDLEEAINTYENYNRTMNYLKGSMIAVVSIIAFWFYNPDFFKTLFSSINTDTLKNLLSAVKLC